MALNGHPLPPAQLIDTSSGLAELVKILREEPVVALDTESNSLYAYHERVCLIQLSTRDQDYLIDPLAIDSMIPLGDITADPEIEIVFHAAEYDIACMKRDFDYEFNTLFDTMTAARVLGYEKVGLANLLERFFEVKQNKRFQRTDWGKRPLSDAQISYAQIDTHYLIALRDLINEQLAKRGAIEEAYELFDETCLTRPAEHEFDPEGYWHIRRTRHFSSRQRACLRELYLWRERQAKRRDVPRFKILTDDKMVQIVEANPRNQRDIQKKGLLSKNGSHRHGSAILKALQKGYKAPPPPPPAPPRRVDGRIMDRHDRLKTWRKQRAIERGVESDIIVRREALWALAKMAPQTMEELAEVPELGDWRRSQYGEEILNILAD